MIDTGKLALDVFEGLDPATIAVWLYDRRYLSVRGEWDSICTTCPIATYLVAVTKSNKGDWTVSPTQATFWPDGVKNEPDEVVYIPQNVSEFISRFDRGEFEFLK